MTGRGDTKASGQDGEPKDSADALEKEIVDVRENIGRLAGELDRRRHALFDLRRHPLPLALAAVAVAAIGAGVIAFGMSRRHRRASIADRYRRLRAALGRASHNPERVARPAPGVGRKVMAAGGSAAAAVVAKELARRLMRARR